MFEVPADAYDRWVGRYSTGLARELIRYAGVAAGQAALDVGCGPGALTAALVPMLGADHVAAVDPSEAFVEACRQRNPGVRVQHASAEALPFADAEFDRVLSQLVVNFLTDAHAGMAEMRRVTRHGGLIAACTWDYAEGMTLIRTFFDAAIAVDRGAAAHDEGRTMRYCRPDELDPLWRETGLNDVEVQPLLVRAAYESFDDLWSPLEYGVGPVGAYAMSLEPGQRAAVRAEFQRRLGVGDKPFELTARAWATRCRVA